MPPLYLTPAALGYLSQLILALLITGYFVVQLVTRRASWPAHTVLLTGFFACITLLMLLFTLDAAFPPTERLYALYLENTVLALGIVLLLQFAYCFPEPFPRRRWEALLALGLSLLYLWSEAEIAIQRFGLVTSAGHVIFRVPRPDHPINTWLCACCGRRWCCCASRCARQPYQPHQTLWVSETQRVSRT